MSLFNDELEIITFFQETPDSLVLLIPESDETEEIIQSILNKEKWKLWVNSSSKKDPPPDFYSDKLGLMMDVMRVDDHSFIGKKANRLILCSHRKIR